MNHLLRLATLLLLAFVPAVSPHAQPLNTPQAVLEAHLRATGGEAAWGRIHALHMEGTTQNNGAQSSGGGRFTDVWRFPGYRRTENEGAMVVSNEGGEQKITIVMINTPEASWAETPMGRQRLPATDPLALAAAKPELTLLHNPAWKLLGVEQKTMQDKPVYAVRYEQAGKPLHRYYDRTTLYLVAAEQLVEGHLLTTWYDDYRRVGEVMLPHRLERQALMQSMDISNGAESGGFSVGSDTIVQTITRIDLNPTLDDKLFQ